MIYILFYFSLKKGMKHVMTRLASAASDWLAQAALKCFTEWVGLCAKEGSAHMAQLHHGQPFCYPNAPPNAPAQPWLYLSMYMLDIDASTDTTYMFKCQCLIGSCDVDQKCQLLFLKK